MAKQGKGNSGKGSSPKVAECAAQGAIGREQAAKAAKLREQRRQGEGPAFFLRLNADRNNNPADIANGIVGKYAIPGGDQPSIHLSVRKHNQKDTSFSVVEFESVQRGHALQGAILDPSVFLGTKWIGDMNWQSRMTGSARTTQENLHGYLSQFIELVPAEQVVVTPVEPAIIMPKLTEADTEALLRAAERRKRKRVNKIVAASAGAALATKLHTMREHAIHPFEFATGVIGYCDLSSNHGELIVLSFVDGGDRKVSIAYLSKSHILTLAGVKVDDAIFASYVMAGRVHESDRSHMNKDDFDRRNAIAKYIHDQLTNRGIRFPAGKKQNA